MNTNEYIEMLLNKIDELNELLRLVKKENNGQKQKIKELKYVIRHYKFQVEILERTKEGNKNGRFTKRKNKIRGKDVYEL